jgi:AcrR family transcriptional regulator
MMGQNGPRDSLRERAKQRTRSEIATAAIELFLSRGFDRVTTEEIVSAVGISRSSFFRYFPTKEDTVLSVFTDFAVRSCREFVSRPAAEEPWQALRNSFTPFTEWIDADPDHALELLRLIDDTPTLRGNFLDRLDRWRTSLTTVLASRMNLEADRVAPAAIAGAGLATLNVACQAWLSSNGVKRFDELLGQAFDSLVDSRRGLSEKREI